MTHYLRSKHDAILIGVGTAVADNPSLNCRIEGVGGYGGEGLTGQPRPVVLDPSGRWQFNAESKLTKLAKEGRGRPPFILTSRELPVSQKGFLEEIGGRNFVVPSSVSSDTSEGAKAPSKMDWDHVLKLLADQGTRSVMIEGGGAIINDLLSPRFLPLVDSVIVTIAPTWLGQGGVQVCPEQRVENGARIAVGRLRDVKWVPLGEDVVLCGRPIV